MVLAVASGVCWLLVMYLPLGPHGRSTHLLDAMVLILHVLRCLVWCAVMCCVLKCCVARMPLLSPCGGVCWALVLSCALSDRVEAKLNLLMSSATAHATCSYLVM
jgi:hypothetical protein